MFLRTTTVSLAVVLLALAAVSGCGKGNSRSDTVPRVTPRPPAARPPRAAVADSTPPVDATKVKPGAVVEKPKAPTLSMPAVILTEQYAESCKVKVGDAMPELTLPDTEGIEHELASLYGKVTVVVFWNGEHPYALRQLEDLGPDVVAKYSGEADGGVKVIAINHGQSASETKRHAEEAAAEFPILLDEDGEAYQQVATRYLPRTYLLDADGKILWLDMEYSRDTRRHLDQAIRSALSKL